MDDELRHNRGLAAVPAAYWDEEMGHPLVPFLNDCLGKGNLLSVALNYREFAEPARKALFVAIITGEGHVLNRRGEPLAVWALRLNKFDLFRELVKRGADVNREYKSLMPTATSATRTPALEVLSAECIAEYGKRGEQTLTPEDHQALLDWLSAYKPELGRPHLDQSVAEAILLGIIAGNSRAAQWALQQGYKPSPNSRNLICCMLCSENYQDALRRLLKEPALGPETHYPGQYCTTLQYLLTLEKLSMRDMLALARILLESGADPNLLPPPAAGGERNIRKTPLSLALQQLSVRPQEEQADALALIRLLVEHRARLAPGESLPENLPLTAHTTLQQLHLMN